MEPLRKKPEINKRGIYGETVVSPYRVKIRNATLFESRRLSSQEFIYYVPYIQMRLVPGWPDPLSEYCFAKQRDIEIVAWELDYELAPKLASSDLTTARIFGIRPEIAMDVFNFVNGLILEDAKTNAVIRSIVEHCQIIEPTISRSKPMEKLLADKLQLVYFGIQTPKSTYRLVADKEYKTLVVQKSQVGDPGLLRLMHHYWTRGEIIL